MKVKKTGTVGEIQGDKMYLTFESTISKMGRHRMISVPTDKHQYLKNIEGKKVWIIVQEI